jgi:hypothetical protein
MKRIFIFFLLLSSLVFGGVLIDSFGQSVATSSNSKNIAAPASSVKLTLPLKDGSVGFGVIGDTGSGSSKQYDLGKVMTRYHAAFPYEFVLLLGDNMYGGETPKDFEKKFSDVYRALLDAKVKFYATLGNHDLPLQANYADFNMAGKEYYRFKKGNIAFYSLNSNYMCFFHHPPYSSAKKHGSDKQLREVVEPIFVRYGVNLVLAGHDHVYERIKPQKGIYYFVSGAGGKLRTGDLAGNSPLTDKSFDKDLHFMLFEVAGDQMYFQTISRTGETIDTGVMARQKRN